MEMEWYQRYQVYNNVNKASLQVTAKERDEQRPIKETNNGSTLGVHIKYGNYTMYDLPLFLQAVFTEPTYVTIQRGPRILDEV